MGYTVARFSRFSYTIPMTRPLLFPGSAAIFVGEMPGLPAPTGYCA